MRLINPKKALVEEKECAVCDKKFYRKKNRVSTGKKNNMVGIRKLGSLTCSKECSRKRIAELNRIDRHKNKDKKRTERVQER